MAVKIHTKLIEIHGPEMHTYDGGPNMMAWKMGENFDKKNQEVVDGIDWGVIKYEIDKRLPPGFHTEIK